LVHGDRSTSVSVPLGLLRKLGWFNDVTSALAYCTLLDGVLSVIVEVASTLNDADLDGVTSVKLRSNKGSYFFTLPAQMLQQVGNHERLKMFWLLMDREGHLSLFGQLTEPIEEGTGNTGFDDAVRAEENRWREARRWVYAYRLSNGLPLPLCDSEGNESH
jgi:hypothetical protein